MAMHCAVGPHRWRHRGCCPCWPSPGPAHSFPLKLGKSVTFGSWDLRLASIILKQAKHQHCSVSGGDRAGALTASTCIGLAQRFLPELGDECVQAARVCGPGLDVRSEDHRFLCSQGPSQAGLSGWTLPSSSVSFTVCLSCLCLPDSTLSFLQFPIAPPLLSDPVSPFFSCKLLCA